MNPIGVQSLLNTDITLKELRVLLAFVCQEELFGRCVISRDDLTNLTRTTPQDISATMRKLEDRGLIIRLDKGNHGRGATAYSVAIRYPSESSDFVPVDTDPSTIIERRLLLNPNVNVLKSKRDADKT